MRTTRPGLVLAASAPAGIHGRPVPAASWIVWSTVPIAAGWVLRSKRGGVAVAARQLALLLPTVMLLTLPAVLFAAAENGLVVGGEPHHKDRAHVVEPAAVLGQPQHQ